MKKEKNVLTTILLVVLAAILGYYIWNSVANNLKAEEPAEAYVLHFEDGPVEELDISELGYEEGMTWSEFIYESNYLARKPGSNVQYYITSTYTTSLAENIISEQGSQNYWILQLNGENIDSGSVMDLSQTYTLVAQ